MGCMHIGSLNLVNFRNFVRLDLELPEGPVVIQGGNAQGKSNFLDAMHILATGRSFRGGPESAWINLDVPEVATFARIRGRIHHATGDDHLEIVAARASGYGGVRRRVRIGGSPRRMADLPGRLHVVSFAPSDLTLLTGPPRDRRRWLDIALAQLARPYVDMLAEHETVLTRRNAVLRRIRSGHARLAELDFWDERLAPLALQIVGQRRQFVNELRPLMASEFDCIGGGATVEIAYEATAVASVHDAYVEALQSSRVTDVERGATGQGPHRDDVNIQLNSQPLVSFGSRGQIRLAAVALKLAQFEVAVRRTGERPVLLLDDVAAELDPIHRQSLLERVVSGTQTFITTADPAGVDVDALAHAPRLTVQRGVITSSYGPA